MSHILSLDTEKFLPYLHNLQFVQRLFLIFDPNSNVFPLQKDQKLLEQVNFLRVRIIEKICESVYRQERKTILYDKVRSSMLFFKNSFQNIQNIQMLLSLRLIFILLEDRSQMFLFDEQICKLMSDKRQQILVVTEFFLFAQLYCYDFEVDHCKKLRDIALSVHCQDDKQMKQLKDFAIEIMSYTTGQSQHKNSIVTKITQYQKQNQTFQRQILQKIQLFIQKETNYLLNLSIIKNLLYQLLKLRLTPQHIQNRNFSYLVYNKFNLYSKKIQRQHSLEFHFFSETLCSLQIRIEQMQRSRKGFKSLLARLFCICKQTKIGVATFITPTNENFFIQDSELLLYTIKLYEGLILSSSQYSSQDVQNVLFSILWMIKACTQNFNMFAAYYKKQQHRNIPMFQVQRIFNKFVRNLKQQHFNRFVYIAVKSIEGMFAVFFQPKDHLLIERFNKLKEVLFPLRHCPIQCMIFFVFYTNLMINLSRADDRFEGCEGSMLEICQFYVKQEMYDIFASTLLLSLITFIIIKKGNYQYLINLLRQIIRALNQNMFSTVFSNFHYQIKFSLQILCSLSEVSAISLILEDLKKTKCCVLFGEEIFIYFFLLNELVRRMREKKEASTQMQIKFGQESFSLFMLRSVVKIALGIHKVARILFNEVRKGVFYLQRQTIQRMNNRKERICLRQEGNFKLFILKGNKQMRHRCKYVKAKYEGKMNNLSVNCLGEQIL